MDLRDTPLDMRLRLKFRNPAIVPPSGFVWLDPDTGHKLEAGDRMSLLKVITSHRASNGLEIPGDFPSVLEDYLCRQNPPNFCKDEFGETHGNPALTTTTVQQATSRVFHLWRQDLRRLCDSEEAERRAAVCIRCPKNIYSAACMSCHGIIAWSKTRIRRTVKGEGELFVCARNGALNRVTINLRKEILMAGERIDQLSSYPEDCWKRKMLETEDG